MAQQVNSFALLGDDESDDLSSLLANVAAKVVVVSSPLPDKKNKKSFPGPAGKLPSKPLPPGESVRTERGRGSHGRGPRGGSGRVGSGGNDSDNGRGNGYQRNYGGGRGRSGGGRGRGRGFNEDVHGFRNGSDQVHGGANENEGEGWEISRGARNFRNENRNGGGGNEGRDRYYGGRDVMRRGGGEGFEGFERREGFGEKKEPEVDRVNENAGWGDWGDPVTVEVAKVAEPEQTEEGKIEEVKIEVVSESTAEKKNVVEEEDKEMTLAEYEKVMLEKRKALEGLKTEERKVGLDKDFEAMLLVEKKKEEDLFIKLKSEKEKLKKKESLEKEEKARKAMNITEFLKPAEGERYGGRARGGRGRGGGRGERSSGRGGYRGGYSGRSESGAASSAAPAPSIEDQGQFPLLGAVAKA